VLISPAKSKKKFKTFNEFEAMRGIKLNPTKLWKIVFSKS